MKLEIGDIFFNHDKAYLVLKMSKMYGTDSEYLVTTREVSTLSSCIFAFLEVEINNWPVTDGIIKGQR